MATRTRRLVPRLRGKQVAVSLYLPQRQYWLLKSASSSSGFPVQYLLRRALEQVLKDLFRQGLVSRAAAMPARGAGRVD